MRRATVAHSGPKPHDPPFITYFTSSCQFDCLCTRRSCDHQPAKPSENGKSGMSIFESLTGSSACHRVATYSQIFPLMHDSPNGPLMGNSSTGAAPERWNPEEKAARSFLTSFPH